MKLYVSCALVKPQVLQCLWAATAHGDAEVQREAYAALALFSAEVLADDCADPSNQHGLSATWTEE